ncbi:MAG: outer membrane protein assembly factor BamA [Deltaproteobacteria bacterium]|nr:outer membrane protein assembly factor BamA [Deltaproteobacteria bacterium]
MTLVCRHIPRLFLLATLIATVFSTAIARAEDPPAEDAKIEGFVIEGLRRVDEEVVKRVLVSKRGEVYEQGKVTQDVRAVFGTNLFRDVIIKRRPGEVHKKDVLLVVEVLEKPSIRNVGFVGNDEIGNDDIKGVIDVKAGQILNIDALAKNVGKIRELYLNKGFYLAEVEFKFDDAGNNEVEVSFVIKENEKVEVRKITFLGNKAVSDDDLKSQMMTKEGHLLSFLTGAGTYREEMFQADLYKLTNIYYDRGYLNARALKPQVQISSDRRHIYITVPIEEGEQFSIGDIGITGKIDLYDDEGKRLVEKKDVEGRITVKKNEIFNRTKLFADLARVADVYRDHGYAYANVTPQTKIHPDTRVVDLDLDIDPGEKVYFETIEIQGNTKTRDKVIRRELRVYEGELFSGSLLEYSKQRVTALGYFETVEVETERGNAPNKMKVLVKIKEKATGTFQVGAGFSSVERFIATAQISQQNFLGRGQSVSLQAQLSFGPFGRQIFTLNFVEPYFLDTELTFNFNGYVTEQRFSDFVRARRGGSLGFGYPLNESGTLRGFLTYTLEHVQVGNNTYYGAQYGRNIFNLNQTGIVSSLRFDLQYDTRDNRLFPTRGFFGLASAEIADQYIGSQFNFLRLGGTARFYYPLGAGFVFRSNAQVGWIWSRSVQGVPISERYYLGGIYSIRGYAPLTVGPSLNVPTVANDPTSANSAFIIGGNKQLQLNLEVEFPIFEKAGFRGVVFVDAGNAYDDNQNFFYIGSKNIPKVYRIGDGAPVEPPLGLIWSAGFGIRWFSPIGPLRFEWGIPFTKIRPYDRDVVFEFTIGNFF